MILIAFGFSRRVFAFYYFYSYPSQHGQRITLFKFSDYYSVPVAATKIKQFLSYGYA